MLDLDQGLGVFTFLWGIVGLFCCYYLARNAWHSWQVRWEAQAARHPRDPARYLAERRAEQETLLLGVGVVLALAGLATNFMTPPELATLNGQMRIVVRAGLILAQLGLTVHSYLIHVNHHAAMNRMQFWQGRQQQAERRDRNVTANTAAVVANMKAVQINTASHEAALHADTAATEFNTVSTDANTAAVKDSTPPRENGED